MTTMYEEMRRAFTGPELKVLDENRIEGGPPGAGTIDLARFWAMEVDAVDASRTADPADPSSWGAHDFVGSLFMRDHLARSIQQLPAPLRERLIGLVRETDERFMSLTTADQRGLAALLGMVDGSQRSWWWQRLPVSGLIRDEFDETFPTPVDRDSDRFSG
jgi:hypothetical protein